MTEGTPKDPLDAAPDMATDPRARDGATTDQQARLLWDAMQVGLYALRAAADSTKAKNYISFGFDGMSLPFDRAEVHLMRPGGMTPAQRADELSTHVDELYKQIENLSVANAEIALELAGRIAGGERIDTEERFSQFVRGMESALARLHLKLDKLNHLAKVAKTWRATPPVDAPVAEGGSTAPWVTALRALEDAVDSMEDVP